MPCRPPIKNLVQAITASWPSAVTGTYLERMTLTRAGAEVHALWLCY